MSSKATLRRQHAGFWLAGFLLAGLHSTCAQTQVRSVTVTYGRPIAQAIEKLEVLYRVPITYEDTLYMNDRDIEDVTAKVRFDHDGSNPNRVLVPATRTITFSLPETEGVKTMSSQSERSGAALEAVKNVLDGYVRAGGTGDFTVSEDSFGVHVVSRAFTDASGRLQLLRPLLETHISITQQRSSALDLVEEICRQVSSGKKVVIVGTIPTNLLANHQVDATNGEARDLLESISKQIGVPISWELFCGPRDDKCALNMDALPQ
jgi:hypothetical protein